jgi:hypothetical protein
MATRQGAAIVAPLINQTEETNKNMGYFNIFSKYAVGCGMADDEERILYENNRRVATMFENGEIEHEDHDGLFSDGQQMWDMYAPYITDAYDSEVCEARGDRRSRIEAYAKAVHEAEAHYEFCFGEEISDELLNKVVPVDWLK